MLGGNLTRLHKRVKRKRCTKERSFIQSRTLSEGKLQTYVLVIKKMFNKHAGNKKTVASCRGGSRVYGDAQGPNAANRPHIHVQSAPRTGRENNGHF